MTQRCIFKSKLFSTFSGLLFCLALRAADANRTSPTQRAAITRSRPQHLRIYLFLPHSARRGDRELILDKQRGGNEEHTRTRTHTYRKKPKKQCGSRSVFVNTFHHRETLNQQRIPWVCLSKDLTKMERVINMSNMTRVALSALKASVQWKGAWTQHTWRTRTKKKTKKENKSLQGGQRKCVDPDTIRYIHCLIYPAHGGGRESPHVCLFFFMFRSGANAWRKYIHWT